MTSSGINDETVQIEIERRKEKQTKSINNVIGHEYTLVEFKKHNNELMEMLKTKEERIKNGILKRNRSMELGQKKKNNELVKKTKEELEELIKKQHEKENLFRISKDDINSKTANGLQQSIFWMESRKNEEINRKILELANEQQARQLKIQLEFEKMAEQQKKEKEQLLAENYKHFLQKETLGKKRLEKVLRNKSVELINKVVDYEKKEKSQEQKRLEVEHRRVNKSMGMSSEFKQKLESIKKFKKEQSLEMDKHNDQYFSTSNDRARKLIEKEQEKKMQKQLELKKLNESSQGQKIRLKTIEMKEKEHIAHLWDRINSKQNMVERNKTSQLLHRNDKFESMNINRANRYDVSKRIVVADEFVREKQLENIKERMTKIDDFKRSKQYIFEQSRKYEEEVNKKKEEVVKVVDEMLKGKITVDLEKNNFTKTIFEITGLDQSFISNKSGRSSLPKLKFNINKTHNNLKINSSRILTNDDLNMNMHSGNDNKNEEHEEVQAFAKEHEAILNNMINRIRNEEKEMENDIDKTEANDKKEKLKTDFARYKERNQNEINDFKKMYEVKLAQFKKTIEKETERIHKEKTEGVELEKDTKDVKDHVKDHMKVTKEDKDIKDNKENKDNTTIQNNYDKEKSKDSDVKVDNAENEMDNVYINEKE